MTKVFAEKNNKCKVLFQNLRFKSALSRHTKVHKNEVHECLPTTIRIKIQRLIVETQT